MNWNDHAKYYDWEFDLICTNQREDIHIWKTISKEFEDPILELCCGSGRITQELIKNGHIVTAIDNSKGMLDILRAKNLPNLEILNSNMTTFKLDRKFKFAFISYSSFQQLLTLEEQIMCLNNIHDHLEDRGVLAMDINPRICEGEEILPRTQSYTAKYQINNSTVTMYTSHRIDMINQIKHWRDEYLEIDENGEEQRTYVEISLKECSLDYMKLLFEKCGFEIINIYGDFNKGKVTENSNNLIYVIRRK
ncbi:MAG: class I SAM-dependent methyltransferase [Candidatus Tenebribacter burtonii]|jgi:trans-aconitate methyltransferase|nr:class I SAM-dependent methyltransferase [Candidatus Tenebribacter burtonii]